MMDELISNVTQKTGLSPKQAKSAESVLEFLTTKLPAPGADHLNSVMSNETTTSEGGSGIPGIAASAIGSFFGKEN